MKTNNAWSTDAEQNVIGAVMIDAGMFSQCAISPNDFFNGKHRLAWEAIVRLYAKREPLDPVSVAEELDRHDQLSNAGGLDYLASMSHNTASTSSAPHYANIVRQYSQLRAAQAIGKKLMMLDDASTLEDRIRELIELTKDAQNHACSIQEAMSQAIDLLDQPSAAATPTGLKDLDEALGGFHNGDLVVVGARPAMGKTAFMLNLALASTVPVGIISGEQGRDQIGMRFIAIDGKVSLHHMRTHRLDDEEWSRINGAISAARDKRIWINDKPAPSIDDVIRQARVWAYEKKIGLLCIDYLQKLGGGEGEDKRNRIGDITAKSKNLARELNIPVILLSQVKREIEQRAMGGEGLGRMPYMSDLSESGIIEQEADAVITLYRPEVYEQKPQYKGLAYVNICKQRHGPTGYLPIAWRGEYLQFGDLAQNEMAYRDKWNAA